METSDKKEEIQAVSDEEETRWSEHRSDNFGYASDEERLAKRGMEDWELVENIPESQKGIPYWFTGVVIAVMLVAVGLSFPFWGNRPGYEREWVDWGFVAAIFYVSAGSVLVYFMVGLYGSSSGGKLDSDQEEKKDEHNV
ncbi:MAG: hypothetical protein R8K20_08910 [Gallionellaceae bacterium]